MEEESNAEIAFLDTLLKRNNGKISGIRKASWYWYIEKVSRYQERHQERHQKSIKKGIKILVYRKPTHTD